MSALIVFAGCGSSASAADKVCHSRAQLRSAVDAVRADVGNGNFGDARDGLTDVQTAFDQLVQDLKGLKSEERAKLLPQIDALVNSVSSIRNATSLSDLQAVLQNLPAQIQALSDSLATDLNCS